jgi:tripeptide aminopeptidase
VTVGAPLSAIGASERRYLNGTFAELCRMDSPPGRECAERVIAELRALGVAVHEDDAGGLSGSGAGNLLARILADRAPGVDDASRVPPRSVLLCAHLDNKTAVAVLLTLARHLRRERAPVDVELLFAVRQQAAPAGAHAVDAARLRRDFGYVFDHPSPIGEVVVGSPSHFRLEARFRGAAADAGVRPEEGRSAILAASRAIAAMRLGRVDEETTVNVGTISGGDAMSVVPERCSLLAEVRSMSDERAQALVAEVVDRVYEAANTPDCDCDVDVSVQRTFAGYRMPARTPAVHAAEEALRTCGHEPVRISSGEASVANALLAQGFATVNLANGTEHNHEPGERVSVAALEGMLDIAVALLDEVAASSPDTSR